MLRILALFCSVLLTPVVASAQQATSAAGASLRVLDRTTGELEDITLQRESAARMGSLIVTLRECRYPRRAINSNAYAYITVVDENLGGVEVFSGWMIASSPALNSMEHTRYDVWVLRCKN